jgi:mono/diheme cytochrome c family protein
MKKLFLLIVVSFGLLAGLMLLFAPRQAVGVKYQQAEGTMQSIPDSVLKVFQKSCIDCHADDGNSMAKSKLNFSKWESYDAAKKVKKAQGICEEMKKGSMPTKGFRKNNPDRIPTGAEIDLVCKWVASIEK